MNDNVVVLPVVRVERHADDGGKSRRERRRQAARADRIGMSPTVPITFHVPLIGELAAMVEADAGGQRVKPETIIAEIVRAHYGADR